MKLDLSDQTLLTSKNYLNGIWIDSDDGEVLNVDNPADGKSFAFVVQVDLPCFVGSPVQDPQAGRSLGLGRGAGKT